MLSPDLDEHRQRGFLMLNQFQRLLLQGASLPTLQNALREADDAFIRYTRLRSRADEVYGLICWYLQQVAGPIRTASSDAA